jgi:hypothetical protein
MTEITRCNRIGFHYNGFLNVLDNSNPAYNPKSSIKIFKKIYFCSNCGTWDKAAHFAHTSETSTHTVVGLLLSF